MSEPIGSGGYRFLYLRSDSPGKVFRFLQRQFAGATLEDQTRLDRLGLLLSHADRGGWRILLGSPDAGPWMESAGAALSTAFPPSVTLLYAEAGETGAEPAWGFRVWAAGAETERAEHPSPRPPGRKSLLARFLSVGDGGAEALAVEWALDRALPVPPIPLPATLDYGTVARLDERGLLVENTPRLYRFTFAAKGTGDSVAV